MFLRKLFSTKNKFTWVLVDLLIVIVGVYCAFLIQRYSENVKNDKERNRIIKALKYEAEVLRYLMTEASAGMAKYADQLEKVKNVQYSDFSNYRFIEPQYDYQTLHYALNLQNPQIIDFELHQLLQAMEVEIRKLEHTERLITEVSANFRRLPPKLSKDSEAFLLLQSQNVDNFERFQMFIRDRGNISKILLETSIAALAVINKHLGPEQTKAIEKKLMLQNAEYFGSEELSVEIGKALFPHFTEEELREIYREGRSRKE